MLAAAYDIQMTGRHAFFTNPESLNPSYRCHGTRLGTMGVKDPGGGRRQGLLGTSSARDPAIYRYAFSPARIGTESQFSLGASGQAHRSS